MAVDECLRPSFAPELRGVRVGHCLARGEGNSAACEYRFQTFIHGLPLSDNALRKANSSHVFFCAVSKMAAAIVIAMEGSSCSP
jgi:hypothetical protein